MKVKQLRAAVGKIGGEGLHRVMASYWPILLIAFIVLNGVLLFDAVPEPMDVAVGQVAKRDIEAPRRAINTYLTDKLRDEAAEAAFRAAAADPKNYEIDPSKALTVEQTVDSVFAVLREEAANIKAGVSDGDLDSLVTQVQQKLQAGSEVDVPREVIRTALEQQDEVLAKLKSEAVDITDSTMRYERISDTQLQEVRGRVAGQVEEEGRPESEQAILTGIIKAVLVPNLSLDRQKVDKAMELARGLVKPRWVEKGQAIVREKDVIQPEDYEVMRDLGLLGRKANYVAVLGVILVVALLTTGMSVYLYQFHRALLEQRSQLILLGLMLFLLTSIAKGASLFPGETAGYLIPTALAGMLLAILLDSRLAIMSTAFLAVIVGIVMGQDTKYMMVALAGGITGVFSVSRVSQRMDLTRAGLIVGMANFVTMIALGLYRSEPFMIKYSVLGVFNGLVSAVLAIGMLPYLETAFGITSSIRLLELSNPNHPLLKRLLMEAPGSYHHSMIVGNLAEAAAEAVGADPLLARVGSQYHDIGKAKPKRSFFFIENQFGADNPHDRMAPSLSTLIITSHVKDGVEMAKKHRLPKELVDIIEQHHGTDLVKFFHHKALETAKEDEQVDEKDFRYPGPRPQTKEAAIVMLADGVEAAVRSMTLSSPGRIEGLVRKIIKGRLNEGQLNESDITFKDLERITEAFVKVLTGIFHRRIEYPEAAEDMAQKLEEQGEVG